MTTVTMTTLLTNFLKQKFIFEKNISLLVVVILFQTMLLNFSESCVVNRIL